MEHTEYLDNFELALIDKLVRLCRSYSKLEGVMPSSEDVDGMWQVLGPEYLADAVEQVRDYPTVSVAWAAYMGMAIANGWDTDWNRTGHRVDIHYGEAFFECIKKFRDIFRTA